MDTKEEGHHNLVPGFVNEFPGIESPGLGARDSYVFECLCKSLNTFTCVVFVLHIMYTYGKYVKDNLNRIKENRCW